MAKYFLPCRLTFDDISINIYLNSCFGYRLFYGIRISLFFPFCMVKSGICRKLSILDGFKSYSNGQHQNSSNPISMSCRSVRKKSQKQKKTSKGGKQKSLTVLVHYNNQHSASTRTGCLYNTD